MLAHLWRLLANWACPARIWRDLGNVGRSRLGDNLLRRPWQ